MYQPHATVPVIYPRSLDSPLALVKIFMVSASDRKLHILKNYIDGKTGCIRIHKSPMRLDGGHGGGVNAQLVWPLPLRAGREDDLNRLGGLDMPAFNLWVFSHGETLGSFKRIYVCVLFWCSWRLEFRVGATGPGRLYVASINCNGYCTIVNKDQTFPSRTTISNTLNSSVFCQYTQPNQFANSFPTVQFVHRWLIILGFWCVWSHFQQIR